MRGDVETTALRDGEATNARVPHWFESEVRDQGIDLRWTTKKKEIKNCATTREYERKVLQRINKRFGQNKEQNCVPPFLLPPTEVRVRIDHVSIGPSDSPGLSQDLVNHWTFSIDDYSPLWVRYTFILLYNSNWVVLRPQTSPNEAGNIEIRKLLKLAPAALLHNWRVELTQR